MKRTHILTALSLVQVLFLTFHLCDDTLRARAGTPEAMGSTFVAVPVLVFFLYAAWLLAERRSGYIILLVQAVLSIGMPLIHMSGTYGVGGSKPTFFFVWTMFVLAVTGMFSMFLAVDGLRARHGSRDRQELT